MKVSIIIPVYNEEKSLASCLDSLKNQEVKPDEIIVVDNNCTDQSISIAKKYGVRIVKEKKPGMIFARNRGFNAAKFAIVARCDADTILPENWIKLIKENFSSGEIDALTTFPIVYDHGFFKNRFLSLLYMKGMRMILGHEVLVGPGMALTKKVWEKVKNEVCLDDKKVHEDIDLSIHIAKYGQIKLDPNLIIYASGRRIKNNPLSFFIEYPIRLVRTINAHR